MFSWSVREIGFPFSDFRVVEKPQRAQHFMVVLLREVWRAQYFAHGRFLISQRAQHSVTVLLAK